VVNHAVIGQIPHILIEYGITEFRKVYLREKQKNEKVGTSKIH
jgi:hypothetical protein